MSNNNVCDALDYESAMDFSKEVSSNVSTRFERKSSSLKLRRSESGRSTGTPSRKRSRPDSSKGRSMVSDIHIITDMAV